MKNGEFFFLDGRIVCAADVTQGIFCGQHNSEYKSAPVVSIPGLHGKGDPNQNLYFFLPQNKETQLIPIKIGDLFDIGDNPQRGLSTIKNTCQPLQGLYFAWDAILPIFKLPAAGWRWRDITNPHFRGVEPDLDGYHNYYDLVDLKHHPSTKLDFGIKDRFKRDLKVASWRIGAAQLAKLVKQSLLLTAKNINLSSSAFQLLVEILDTEYGEAIVSYLGGLALNRMSNDKAQRLAKELRIHGMAKGANLALDEFTSLIGGQLITIIKDLPQAKIDSKIKEEELEEQNEVLYGRSGAAGF